MKTILVTGGTVFVSKYISEYFVSQGCKVYVLNRNNHPQPLGTTLIQADRHQLGDTLKKYHFDAVIDVAAYNKVDISDILDSLGSYEDYIFISSSAVYPESLSQPFGEDMSVGPNIYWGNYGTDKIGAENELISRVPDSYILRPPYLYGPMNNVYREAFVFDCARQKRIFYLPQDGTMKLQFFHVRDLCRCIESILKIHPRQHIFNVGNKQSVSVKEWVDLCYSIAGTEIRYANVSRKINQRDYFPFYDYEYALNVNNQKQLIDETIPLEEGLIECYKWYQNFPDEVRKKGYITFIDTNLAQGNQPLSDKTSALFQMQDNNCRD